MFLMSSHPSLNQLNSCSFWLFIRSRSRSRSYERSRRHLSRSPLPSSSKSKISERVHVSEADLAGKTPEEVEMMKTMGFCGFDTTKGKKVDGNNKGEVHVILKRKYRWVDYFIYFVIQLWNLVLLILLILDNTWTAKEVSTDHWILLPNSSSFQLFTINF